MMSANKEDPIADALEALTSEEWRRRNDKYECRLNRTQANAIVLELAEVKIAANAVVSGSRSGRYIVTVLVSDSPQIIKAAGRLPQDDEKAFFRSKKKWRE